MATFTFNFLKNTDNSKVATFEIIEENDDDDDDYLEEYDTDEDDPELYLDIVVNISIDHKRYI